ncbi:hypothetical protein [Flavobacterium sp. ALD4]|nr:hypothetical protein [Flavobacterium sp. ALD4]
MKNKKAIKRNKKTHNKDFLFEKIISIKPADDSMAFGKDSQQ